MYYGCRGRDWLRPVPISTLLQTGTDYVYLPFLLNILWLCKVGNHEQGCGSVSTDPKPTLLQTDTDNAHSQAKCLQWFNAYLDSIIPNTLWSILKPSLYLFWKIDTTFNVVVALVPTTCDDSPTRHRYSEPYSYTYKVGQLPPHWCRYTYLANPLIWLTLLKYLHNISLTWLTLLKYLHNNPNIFT